MGNRRILGRCALVASALAAAACGGGTSSSEGATDAGAGGASSGTGGASSGTGGAAIGGGAATGGTSSGGGMSAGGSQTGGAGGGATGGTDGGRVPAVHRATAPTCDNVRATLDPGAPTVDAGGPPVECRTHAECTAGDNGRCVGNGRDGWRCSYDECFVDDDCSGEGAVCRCEGGFRSDNNRCTLEGNCRIDADCGTGFCSPTLGSCGNYAGIVGYYCHTPGDECVDDADCAAPGQFGPPYCAYSPVAGRWQCESSHCVG